MNRIAFFGLCFVALFNFGENVYEYSVPKIEGGSQQLSAFQGKRMLIITLPIAQNASNDSMLYSLDTLAQAHQNDLKVIGVPCYEDGYTPQIKESLNQWYRTKLGSGVIISDGLYARRTSGALQHPLFDWLTNENLNEVFRIDVEGPGYKFFISSSGNLYGVFRTPTPIGGNTVQNLLHIN